MVFAGGYANDLDLGDYFLFTGSGNGKVGGTNIRFRRHQTQNQVFTRQNEALRRSGEEGLCVRVVRSSSNKRSRFAPSKADERAGRKLRLDGLYRIAAAYRRPGVNKSANGKRFLVCRFVFVRCDTSPAPWTTAEASAAEAEAAADGDEPAARPPRAGPLGWEALVANIPEAIREDMRHAVSPEPEEKAGKVVGAAVDINGKPLPLITRPRPDGGSWDLLPTTGEWDWIRPQPCLAEKPARSYAAALEDADAAEARALRKSVAESEKMLAKKLKCGLCLKLLESPLTLSCCSRSFCHPCLKELFAPLQAQEEASQRAIAEAKRSGGLELRARQLPRVCPKCYKTIGELPQAGTTNAGVADAISALQASIAEKKARAAALEEAVERRLRGKEADRDAAAVRDGGGCGGEEGGGGEEGEKGASAEAPPPTSVAAAHKRLSQTSSKRKLTATTEKQPTTRSNLRVTAPASVFNQTSKVSVSNPARVQGIRGANCVFFRNQNLLQFQCY